MLQEVSEAYYNTLSGEITAAVNARLATGATEDQIIKELFQGPLKTHLKQIRNELVILSDGHPQKAKILGLLTKYRKDIKIDIKVFVKAKHVSYKANNKIFVEALEDFFQMPSFSKAFDKMPELLVNKAALQKEIKDLMAMTGVKYHFLDLLSDHKLAGHVVDNIMNDSRSVIDRAINTRINKVAQIVNMKEAKHVKEALAEYFRVR